MIKNIIGILIIIVFTATGLNAAVCLNDIVPVYSEPYAGEIENNIIDGSSKFLCSYSEALLILNEYEVAAKGPFNSSKALLKTEAALNELEKSKASYSKALIITENLEYVTSYKNKLMNCDYDSYLKGNNLNISVADEVITFLREGNVKGLYMRNLEKIDKILEILKNINADLTENKIPEISVFWNLLQNYSETALFGNYSTLLANKAFN